MLDPADGYWIAHGNLPAIPPPTLRNRRASWLATRVGATTVAASEAWGVSAVE